MILLTDSSTKSVAGFIQTDAEIDLSDVLCGARDQAANFSHHPSLVLVRFFLNHFTATANRFTEVLQKVQKVDQELMREMRGGSTKKSKIPSFGRMSQILHEARMELAELARRRTFEKDFSRLLHEDLKREGRLLSRVAMYSGISRSHDLALEALPKRIESQATVVSTYLTLHPRLSKYHSSLAWFFFFFFYSGYTNNTLSSSTA